MNSEPIFQPYSITRHLDEKLDTNLYRTMATLHDQDFHKKKSQGLKYCYSKG